jgi:hypothetical protein
MGPTIGGIAEVRRPFAFALALLLASAAAGDAPERVVLKPDQPASWTLRHVFAFLRGSHYYGERTLEVETTPPGAKLDLFYVRASFQKRYEQAEAPVTVELPRRIEAGPRDSVTIRAFKEGYKLETVNVRVLGGQDKVQIDLAPLPNALEGVSHTYFAGREALGLLLKEAPTARVQNGADGFTVMLAETARPPDVSPDLGGIRSPLVAGIEAQQLGEDLLLRVQLAEGVAPGDLELRSRQSSDEVRDLYRFTIDLVPSGSEAADIERARKGLAQIQTQDVTGCAAAFDDALRGALDPAQLARAVAPRGEFTDPYMRSALRRLGEVSPGGVIRLEDGSRYRPGVPLELAAAASQASSAKGYLALLRRWTELIEPPAFRDEALRSLVAPELDEKGFGAALADARATERRCQGARADGEVSRPAGPG